MDRLRAALIPMGRSVVIDLAAAALPSVVLHCRGRGPGTSDVQLVVDAPQQLKVVQGELPLKKGDSDDSASLPPRNPGAQRAGDLD